MRRWIILVLLSGLLGCVTTNSASVLPASYRLAEGPDAAGQLTLSADGRFGYALTAGAVDERAKGRWEKDGSAICLFTEPRPVAPEFSRGPGERREGESRRLQVRSPDGNGIAGVDFRLGLEDGSVIENYTQHDGWTMAPGDLRKPIWVELSVSMHGLKSPRFKLDEGDLGPWYSVLTPNDLGVVDFQGACLRREGSGYELERDGGTMRFERSVR